MIITHFLTPLLGLALASLPAHGQQIVYDTIHNATVLTGSWSSGSKAVLTGDGFANPAAQSFKYPRTTGVSYSFSDDGFYEVARYRFNGNGSEPSCITGVIGWVHGTYELLPNGSIVLHPMGDGFQQVQDPCAAISNFIEPYNLTELYQKWRIFQDPQTLEYKLHLFQWDGAPVAPQFRVSDKPNMLPTRLLRNDTAGVKTKTTNGLTKQVLAVSRGERQMSLRWSAGGAVGAFFIAIASLVL